MTGEGRRKLLFLAGAAALVVGWQRYVVRPDELDFRPVKGAAGWQFAAAGEVSGLTGSDLMTLGLEKGPEPLPASRLDAVVHRDRSGDVPVAVFSDFFCPFCRELIARIQTMGARGVSMSVTWHELPLLGPNSDLAARAAVAASLQGGYAAFYGQLLTDGFRPVPAWMGEVAGRAGLDGARLVQDMGSPQVAERLGESAAAAARLGFFATPGLVIGRKAILGALDRERMQALVEADAS